MLGENWLPPFMVMVAYAALVVYAGLSARGKLDMNKVENWGNAGSTISGVVMYFTLGGAMVSAYTFMGAPGWSYTKGVPIMYVYIYLLNMIYSNYFFGPRAYRLFRDHGISTMPEAIGVRYNSGVVRGLIALCTSVTLVFYAVLQITGCGYIVSVMSGGVIPTWLAMVITTFIIVLYVFRSGLRGVGWSNVVQGILMLTIGWVVAFIVSYRITGQIWFSGIFEKILEVKPTHLTLPGSANDFSGLYWTTTVLVSTFSFWPNTWVAFTGTKDEASIRRTCFLQPTFYFASMLPMIVVGFVCVFALSGFTDAMDKAGLTLAMKYVPWPIAGLLAAGTFAAAQSSVSPLYHGVGMLWTQDVLGPLFKWSPETTGKAQRWMAVLVAFFLILPFSMTQPTSLPSLLIIGYGFLSQAYPVLLAAFIWPRSTKIGAIVGLVAGVSVLCVCSFVYKDPLNIHAGVWGWMVNIPLHIVVSLMTQPNSKETLGKFYPKRVMDNLYETTR